MIDQNQKMLTNQGAQKLVAKMMFNRIPLKSKQLNAISGIRGPSNQSPMDQ